MKKTLMLGIALILASVSQAAGLTIKSITPSEVTKSKLDDLFPATAATAEANGRFLSRLVNHAVDVRFADANGTLAASYAVAKASAAGRVVTVIQDFSSFVVDSNKDRYGIVIRLSIDITSAKADVNVNGLFNIGLEAKANKIKGNIRMEVFGLGGKSIINTIPLAADLTESSIQQYMQAMASVKANIFADDVIVLPQKIEK